jgi:hypothetical protein
MAKLSYGAWEREIFISSWMIHEEGTGIEWEAGMNRGHRLQFITINKFKLKSHRCELQISQIRP